MGKLITFLRDHSTALKYLFFAYLIAAVVFDFFVHRHEPHFWGDNIIGFWTLFGFFGCLGMSIFCKGLYNNWLKQDEDYYDK